MEKERLNRLGQGCMGEEHYQGLCRFFEDIWNEAANSDYCVFLARRCYNLHELFFATFGKRTYVPCKKALSDNALLLKGKEFARVYYEKGTLPSMLIVDDILIHGRALTAFLYRLERKIRNELLVLGANQDQLRRLYLTLVQSVKIRVYFENDDNILLNENYRGRLKSCNRVPRKIWHRFSQGVSQMLAFSDVANTSFVLSTEGALEWGDAPVSDKWTVLPWLLWTGSTFYYHALPVGPSRYIIFSSRIREPRTRVGTRWIPFLFTGEARVLDVSRELCSLMEATIEKGSVAPFQEIILQKEVEIQKAQLVQLILSCVALYWFCRENVNLSSSEAGNLGYICDIEKISRNFSATRNFSEALKNLFNEETFMEQCYALLPKWFRGIHVQSDRPFYSSEQSKRKYFDLNRMMEEAMYQEGLQSERFAFLIGKTGRAYSPVHDNLPPSSVEAFVNQDGICEFPLYHCLSSLMMLADSGVTSLKPQLWQEKMDFQALRAGEQALFCKPRQLAIYMPSLVRIEDEYLLFGTDWVIRRIQAFQEFLKDRM